MTAPGKTLVENLPQPLEETGKSRDKVAEKLNISGKTTAFILQAWPVGCRNIF